jgi:hypothetical protein
MVMAKLFCYVKACAQASDGKINDVNALRLQYIYIEQFEAVRRSDTLGG